MLYIIYCLVPVFDSLFFHNYLFGNRATYLWLFLNFFVVFDFIAKFHPQYKKSLDR